MQEWCPRCVRGDGDPRVETVERALDGDDPVLLDAPDRLRVLRRLEAAFPTLEAAGAKVGIGVATGADKFFIRFRQLAGHLAARA